MGFFGHFFLKKDNKEIRKAIFNNINYEDNNLILKRTNIEKFSNDKLFFIEENILFLLDGIILNNHELEKEYNGKNWKETYLQIYKENSATFFNKLRGNFVGLVYDIKKEKLTLFVDHLRNKGVYYSIMEDKVIFSTEQIDLASLDKEKNELDLEAAYLLLTFGATLEERTLFKNIKKLDYGTLIEIDSLKNIRKNKYYEIIVKEDSKLKKEEVIEKIESLFSKAIEREYKKDLEYKYIHLATLSAGRDSRMNNYFAKKLGFKNIVNITFSETNELDEKIPKKISNHLKNEWIFKSLDNGIGIFNEEAIEEIIKITCGEVHYGILAHSYHAIKYLNLDIFGVLHSGQLGDVVIGNFGAKTKISNDNIEELKYVYSKFLLNKVKEKKLIKNFYNNEEHFNYVNRGIYVANGGYTLFPNLYVVSPFLDIDFFEFCLKIPYNLRKDNSLYDEWILKNNKKMAEYSHNGRKIGGKEIKVLGRNVLISQLIPKILKKLKILKSEKGMNPFDNWYFENEDYKNNIDKYFEENIVRLDSFKELKEDCTLLYNRGNVREKLQVIGLLATLKLYFKK